MESFLSSAAISRDLICEQKSRLGSSERGAVGH